MYKEEQLLQQLKALGIKSTDTVTVHISMKAVGEIDTTEKKRCRDDARCT